MSDYGPLSEDLNKQDQIFSSLGSVMLVMVSELLLKCCSRLSLWISLRVGIQSRVLRETGLGNRGQWR